MKISRSALKGLIKECLVEESASKTYKEITYNDIDKIQAEAAKAAAKIIDGLLPDHDILNDYKTITDPSVVKYADDEETLASAYTPMNIGDEFFENQIDNETFDCNDLLINDERIDEHLDDYGISDSIEIEDLDQFIKELVTSSKVSNPKVTEVIDAFITRACNTVMIVQFDGNEDYVSLGLVDAYDEAAIKKLIKQ